MQQINPLRAADLPFRAADWSSPCSRLARSVQQINPLRAADWSAPCSRLVRSVQQINPLRAADWPAPCSRLTRCVQQIDLSLLEHLQFFLDFVKRFLIFTIKHAAILDLLERGLSILIPDFRGSLIDVKFACCDHLVGDLNNTSVIASSQKWNVSA